jgi:hypothetical protein
MSCLGTNITEVKNTVRQGVQSLLKNSGGELNADGTVELGNTRISDIAEYLNEAFYSRREVCF